MQTRLPRTEQTMKRNPLYNSFRWVNVFALPKSGLSPIIFIFQPSTKPFQSRFVIRRFFPRKTALYLLISHLTIIYLCLNLSTVEPSPMHDPHTLESIFFICKTNTHYTVF